MLYEGLTRCLPGGAVEPALAESVQLSEDQKTYTFFLRKAHWSNGRPITAYDFERSWKKILNPPSVCAYLFYPIRNAEKCAKKEVSVEEVAILALDDQTLQVILEHPTPYFYSLTAFPSFLPAPENDQDIGQVFSGPFRIEKIARNSEIILVKNETFWNQKAISLDAVHISILPDEMTSLQLFERGDLDWLGGPLSPLPFDAIEKLQSEIFFIPSSASTLCTFNTQTFPFDNIHLRKAFSYAIDRREIAEIGQIPAQSLLPPSLTQQTHPLTDPLQARDYLEKAQIDPKELKLVLHYKSGQAEKRLAQMLQRQWQEKLGVTVQLAQLDAKSHGQRLQNRDYQIALVSWIAQFDDPISILERFKDRANLKNYPGWENDQYIALLSQAALSNQRAELLQKAETLLAEEMPLTPIYHWSSPAIHNSRIEEIGTTPSGGILFERFKLAKKK